MEYSFLANSDMAVTVEFKKEISNEVNARVVALDRLVRERGINGVIETVPAFSTLTVFYDCTVISEKRLKRLLTRLIGRISVSSQSKVKVWDIPVCYDPQFALDMDNVCRHTGLSRDEVIDIHTSKPYLIYMLGFLPGFPYLGIVVMCIDCILFLPLIPHIRALLRMPACVLRFQTIYKIIIGNLTSIESQELIIDIRICVRLGQRAIDQIDNLL